MNRAESDVLRSVIVLALTVGVAACSSYQQVILQNNTSGTMSVDIVFANADQTMSFDLEPGAYDGWEYEAVGVEKQSIDERLRRIVLSGDGCRRALSRREIMANLDSGGWEKVLVIDDALATCP